MSFDEHFKQLKTPMVLLMLAVALIAVWVMLAFTYCRYLVWIALLAYLSSGLMTQLERKGISSTMAALVVTLGISGILITAMAVVLPVLVMQGLTFAAQVPDILSHLVSWLQQWDVHLENWNLQHSLIPMLNDYSAHFTRMGSHVLLTSYHTIGQVFFTLVLILLAPFILFLVLRDRHIIARYCRQRFVPHSPLIHVFFERVNQKMSAYLSGKLLEACVFALAMFVLFSLFHLGYALMLSILMGLSVFVPLFGVVLASIPVAILALSAWGFSHDLWLFGVSFVVLIIADGHVLVPLLFSQRLGLHPLPILLAVLIGGELMGFWGMLLAIPMLIVIDTLVELLRDQCMH